MTTSVVIPAYNGQKFLDVNLPSVLALGADEIIIVDDASIRPVEASNIKIIRHKSNLGFPISVNDGFAAASGDIVILLNQDVKPDKNLLKYTLPHFADPKVFAVTFNESASRLPAGRSWAKLYWEHGLLQYKNGTLDNKIHLSAWASGGSAAFRKSTWDDLKGFDPIFSPGYSEDLDLGIRATKAGYKIIWDPKCRVRHQSESSFNQEFPRRKLQLIKDCNYLLLQWKHINPKDVPAHVLSLLKRSTRHPGFLVPILMALSRLLSPNYHTL